MNSSALRNLGIVLVALVAILIGLEMADQQPDAEAGRPLFESMKDRINELDQVSVARAGEETVRLRNDGTAWVVENRNDYPADVAKVREILLALADASVLEQKTANPERYSALGVRDPSDAGSEGVLLSAAGADIGYGVILGKSNQGSNRYARRVDDGTSLLIDRNPSVPDSVGGWLDPAIIDVAATDVRTATIEHADGETIRIEKSDASPTSFDVLDLPEGRELSYPTVANSLGAALNDFDLEDVRAAGTGESTSVATFETTDGRQVVVTVFGEGDETWVAVSVAAGNAAGDDIGPIDELNARFAGREFRIADYKANQLTRRWDDLLKPVDDGE